MARIAQQLWLCQVALTVHLNMVKVVLYYVTFTTKIKRMAQSKKKKEHTEYQFIHQPAIYSYFVLKY